MEVYLCADVMAVVIHARFAWPYSVVLHSKPYQNIFMKLNINLKWRKPETLSDLMSMTFCLVIHQLNWSGGESKYGWFSYHLISNHCHESPTSILQCTDQLSPLRFNTEQLRPAEHCSAWWSRWWISTLSHVGTLWETYPAALILPVALTVAGVITSPLRL